MTPNVKQAAGIIASRLCVDPLLVNAHRVGLRAAERIDGNGGNAEAFADLLCAVMSTDVNNSTGPYHLPFAGGFLMHAGSPIEAIGPHSNMFEKANRPMGEMLAFLMANTAERARGSVQQIKVKGHGAELSGFLMLDGSLVSLPAGYQLWFWYGYEPADALIQKSAFLSSALTISAQINGAVVDDLGALLMGAPYEIVPAETRPQSEAVQ